MIFKYKNERERRHALNQALKNVKIIALKEQTIVYIVQEKNRYNITKKLPEYLKNLVYWSKNGE